MATKVSTHTFTKGMVTDKSNMIKDPASYDYAENLRHTSNEESILGSLTTLDGFEQFTFVSGDIPSSLIVVAQTTVRNKLYFLCAGVSGGGVGSIYSTTVDYENKELSDLSLLYGGGNIGLDADKNTDIVSIYESDDVIKLYWVTEGEQLKVANVATYLTSDGLAKHIGNTWIDYDRFNIITSRRSKKLGFEETVSGTLETGRVQYCYSLYRENSQESLISPLTGLIDLFQDRESDNSVNVKGDYTSVNTNKGVRLSLSLDSDDADYFDYIRLYRIHYKEYNQVPIITIVNDFSIVDDTLYNIIDNGSDTYGELTLEEFSVLLVPYGGKSLATKDNRLFLANIEEYTFDLPDFDARAYRFFSPYQTISGSVGNTGVVTGYYDIFFSSYIYLGVGDTVKITINSLPAAGFNATVTAVQAAGETYQFLISEATAAGAVVADSLSVSTIMVTSNIVSDLYTDYGTYTTPEFTINASTLVYPDMVTEATLNCINPFNDIAEDYDYTQLYMYQSNGTTLGGEGPEIKYTFSTNTAGLDDTGSYSDALTYKDEDDFSHTEQIYSATGYQRDEIYRFGVVFYNEMGQRSKVKWVGDIRMPSHSTSFTNLRYIAYSTGAAISSYNIGVTFTLKNGLPSGAIDWEVVRAIRTKEDRSIISSGFISLTSEGTTDCSKNGWPFFDTTNIVEPAGYSINYKILNYATPEEEMQGYTDILKGDYLDIVGDITNYITFTTTGATYPDYDSPQNTLKLRRTRYNDNLFDNERFTINANNFIKAFPYANVDETIKYNYTSAANSIYKVTSSSASGFLIGALYFSKGGFHGACSVIELTGGTSTYVTDFSSSHNNHDFPYILIKRNTTSRYGGYTYLDRENTSYISCGNASSSTAITCYGGDTFINMYDYLFRPYAYTAAATNGSNSLNVIYPTESPINLSLRSDDHPAKLYGASNGFIIQETAGAYTVAGGDSYTQESDLYLYNSVYSQQSTVQYYYALNHIDAETTFDSRIIHSDKKINNELIDNWLKFSANNILDVDSKYGEITTIRNFNNNIYFWQNHAFGGIPVNERALIQDNNPGTLALGVGEVMSRYVYYTVEYGCDDLLSILSTGVGLYWIDRVRKTIIMFDGSSVHDVAKKQGFKTEVKEIIEETTTPTAFTFSSCLNQDFNEILFKLSDSKQLIYNYALPGLSSILTSYSDMTFNTRNLVISYYLTEMFKHDSDKINQNNCIASAGGLEVKDSTLRITDTSDYAYTKVYDNITFFSNATDYSLVGSSIVGYDNYNEFFNTVSFWNDYQYTGVIDLTLDDTIQRRERKMVASIPRNIVDVTGVTAPFDKFDSANHDTSRTFRERLRDNYITAEFIYDDTNTGKLVLPYIQFTYRISKR